MNKVQQVNELHSKAMEMANLAFIARVQGEPDKVQQFSKTAFDYECQAALLLLTDYGDAMWVRFDNFSKVVKSVHDE